MVTHDSEPVAQMDRPVFRLHIPLQRRSTVLLPSITLCMAEVRQKATSIFIDTPNAIAVEDKTQGGDGLRIFPVSAMPEHAPGHGRSHGHRFHQQSDKHSFLIRVHFGCGIGILLYMLMVLISYCMIKGQRPASEEQSSTLSSKEIFVAPLHYTYPIEKVKIVEPVAAESR
ncbi:hypothetical protein C8R43DRAFT_332288 [Mycena crocata]|nr:hypothetical protein C8R43DRAFT_558606 [Mycena crocata]KAJ7161377.1 hypothetical protein C8R43DRAFT_332288 [Mycena crocata]